VEVVLIAVGDPRRWQLPKGRIERGESAEDAARREVREETGIDTVLVGRLGDHEYWFRTSDEDGQPLRVRKRVHHFLLRARGGTLRGDPAEVDEARWFEVGEAIEALTFENDRKVMGSAKSRLAALGPRVTSTTTTRSSRHLPRPRRGAS
jgi:8-oxo-dGTP pyrophosphatase MutT (NUDIX family)